MIHLFRVSVPTSVLWLILGDFAILLGCHIAALDFARFQDLSLEFYLFEEQGLIRCLIAVLVIQAGLYFADLYASVVVRSNSVLVNQVALILGAAFLAQALLGYGQTNLELPQWTMVYASAGLLVIMPFWRIAYSAILSRAFPSERVLFILPSEPVAEIMTEIARRPELGYKAIGYVDIEPRLVPAQVPFLGPPADLRAILKREQPNRIVIGREDCLETTPIHELIEWRFLGFRVESATSTYETIFHRVLTRAQTSSHLLLSSRFDPSPANTTFQTLYSLPLAAAAALVTLPIMAVVAILVRVTSPGPVLFRQQRVGLRGTTFTLYKFRSMYADAEARTGAVWASQNDPRVTPVGRWLRRLRLDEIPQFFNVIRGEMALVGPRPERPEFCKVLEEKIPHFRLRECVKPGITGWAQINYKYGDTLKDTMMKLEYDLYYIKNFAPALDAYIIFHTIKVMVLSRGAQ